jgi:hypothetical protein
VLSVIRFRTLLCQCRCDTVHCQLVQHLKVTISRTACPSALISSLGIRYIQLILFTAIKDLPISNSSCDASSSKAVPVADRGNKIQTLFRPIFNSYIYPSLRRHVFREHVESKPNSFPYMSTKILLVTLGDVLTHTYKHFPFNSKLSRTLEKKGVKIDHKFSKPILLLFAVSIFQAEPELF